MSDSEELHRRTAGESGWGSIGNTYTGPTPPEDGYNHSGRRKKKVSGDRRRRRNEDDDMDRAVRDVYYSDTRRHRDDFDGVRSPARDGSRDRRNHRRDFGPDDEGGNMRRSRGYLSVKGRDGAWSLRSDTDSDPLGSVSSADLETVEAREVNEDELEEQNPGLLEAIRRMTGPGGYERIHYVDKTVRRSGGGNRGEHVRGEHRRSTLHAHGKSKGKGKGKGRGKDRRSDSERDRQAAREREERRLYEAEQERLVREQIEAEQAARRRRHEEKERQRADEARRQSGRKPRRTARPAADGDLVDAESLEAEADFLLHERARVDSAARETLRTLDVAVSTERTRNSELRSRLREEIIAGSPAALAREAQLEDDLRTRTDLAQSVVEQIKAVERQIASLQQQVDDEVNAAHLLRRNQYDVDARMRDLRARHAVAQTLATGPQFNPEVAAFARELGEQDEALLNLYAFAAAREGNVVTRIHEAAALCRTLTREYHALQDEMLEKRLAVREDEILHPAAPGSAAHMRQLRELNVEQDRELNVLGSKVHAVEAVLSALIELITNTLERLPGPPPTPAAVLGNAGLAVMRAMPPREPVSAAYQRTEVVTTEVAAPLTRTAPVVPAYDGPEEVVEATYIRDDDGFEYQIAPAVTYMRYANGEITTPHPLEAPLSPPRRAVGVSLIALGERDKSAARVVQRIQAAGEAPSGRANHADYASGAYIDGNATGFADASAISPVRNHDGGVSGYTRDDHDGGEGGGGYSEQYHYQHQYQLRQQQAQHGGGYVLGGGGDRGGGGVRGGGGGGGRSDRHDVNAQLDRMRDLSLQLDEHMRTIAA